MYFCLRLCGAPISIFRACLCVILIIAFLAGAPAQADDWSPVDAGQATASYRIDVKLDPVAKTLQGKQTLTYVNASPDALSELPFHLYLNAFAGPDTIFMREGGGQLRGDQADLNAPGWIKVNDVRLASSPLSLAGGEGQHLSLTYNDDRTVMTVTLPAPLAPGATLMLDMDFAAQLPKVFARTGWWGDDFFMVGQWFPKIAVYDDLGWHSWPFHANAEFFADFGVYDVSITVPQSYVVGATGFPQGSQDNGDGTKTETFHAADVIDFAWTASPHYQTATRQWNDVEIVLLYQPEHQAYVGRYLEATQQAIEFYVQRVGPYVYKRLTIVDPPAAAGGAGGMEYPMLVTSGVGMMGIPELPGSAVYDVEMVTMHEIGHNWFGMVVATNEAEEPWLDEGFTDFISVEALDHFYGRNTSMIDAPFLKLGSGQSRRLEYLVNPRVPSYGKAWEFTGMLDYSIAAYSKPVMALTTLKNTLGQELFWRVLQTYYARYQFKHPRTEDFIAVAEEISGQQLDWFFDQAVYGDGVLNYAVESVASQRQSDKSYQSQAIVKNLGTISFPVTVRAAFADGAQVDEIWDGQGTHTFAYTRARPLAWVHIDPSRKLAMMELDLQDNSRTLRPQTGSTLRIGSRILFWFQNLLVALGEM